MKTSGTAHDIGTQSAMEWMVMLAECAVYPDRHDGLQECNGSRDRARDEAGWKDGGTRRCTRGTQCESGSG